MGPEDRLEPGPVGRAVNDGAGDPGRARARDGDVDRIGARALDAEQAYSGAVRRFRVAAGRGYSGVGPLLKGVRAADDAGDERMELDEQARSMARYQTARSTPSLAAWARVTTPWRLAANESRRRRSMPTCGR
jgi:hypothetical protein